MDQVRCPGCGVWVSPGQGVCAFCQRQAPRSNRARFLVFALGAALVGMALLVGAFFAREPLSRVISRRNPVPQHLQPQPEPLKPGPVQVTVSESALFLDGVKLLDLPPPEQRAQLGVGEAWKRSGPHDLFIVPLGNALARARQEAGRDPTLGVCRVAPGTPFRILIEVLFTLGQSDYSTYRISIPESPAGPATELVTWAPAAKRAPGHGRGVPFVKVNVQRHGVDLDTHRGRVGVSCAANKLGTAVEIRTVQDYPALATCIEALTVHGSIHTSTPATVTAYAEVPASLILYAANTLRCGRVSCPEPPAGAAPARTVLFGIPRDPQPPAEYLDAVRALRPTFAKCYEATLVEHPWVGYRAAAEMHLPARGPREVVLDPGLPASFERCLHQTLMAAKLPPPGPEGAILNIPLTFAPKG